MLKASVCPLQDFTGESHKVIKLGRFSAFFTRETTRVTFCLLSAHQAPPGKWSTLKGKNLLLRGANSYLLDSFSGGGKIKFDRVASLEDVSIPLKE